jgi:hypothetical protein
VIPGDDSEQDLTPGEIRGLDDLIRRSRAPDESDQPLDDGLVAAYLAGRATPEEVETVQRRLAESSELREDLVYEAGLYRTDVQARFDAAPGPARATPAVTRRGKATGWWLRKPLFWGGLVPVALAVVVIVFLLPRPEEIRWMEQAVLSTEQFERDPYRGQGEAFPKPANSEEAAMLALLRAVEWDGSEFQVDMPPGDQLSGRTLRAEFEGASPPCVVTVPEGAELLDVWFLALPSLKRYRTVMSAEILRIPWPDAAVERGVVTITYRTTEGLAATSAQLISRH